MGKTSLFIIAAISVCVTYAHAGESPSDPASFYDRCPGGPDEWTQWRQKLLSAGSTQEVLSAARGTFFRCGIDATSPFDRKRFPACVSDIYDFLQSQMAFMNHFDDQTPLVPQSEKDYYDAAQLPFPDMLSISKVLTNDQVREASQALAQSDNAPGSFISAITDIQLHNPGLKAFSFTSGVIKGDRSIVLVKDYPGYEQWLHIGGGQVLMLAIQKQTPNGAPLRPPRIFFDFQGPEHDPQTGKSTGHLAHERGSRPDHCIACHRTGAMPLVPMAGTEITSFQPSIPPSKAASWINDRITQNANALPRSANMKLFGPAMGAVDPPYRTEATVAACAKSALHPLSPASVAKIKAAMNCASCHDGRGVGQLTFPLGSDAIQPSGMLQHFIASGHMPPATPLSSEERSALVDCLRAEFYGGFAEGGAGTAPGVLNRSLLAGDCVAPGQAALAPPATGDGSKERAATRSLAADVGADASSPVSDAGPCGSDAPSSIEKLVTDAGPGLNQALTQDSGDCDEQDATYLIRAGYRLNVKRIFDAKCADCHSKSAPAPALSLGSMDPRQRDIARAQKVLVMGSDYPFQSPTGASPTSLLMAIDADVKATSMPPGAYTFFHRSAVVTAAEKQAISDWVKQAVALRSCLDNPKLSPAGAPPPTPTERANRVVAKCVLCHAKGGSGAASAEFTSLAEAQKNPALACQLLRAVKGRKMPPGADAAVAADDAAALKAWADSQTIRCP